MADLVDLYTDGMRAPLPLPCETAFAWQADLAAGRGRAVRSATAKWQTDRFSPESGRSRTRVVAPTCARRSTP